MRLEVALDDVHTCSCLPSGMGCTAGGGTEDVIVRVEKFP